MNKVQSNQLLPYQHRLKSLLVPQMGPLDSCDEI